MSTHIHARRLAALLGACALALPLHAQEPTQQRALQRSADDPQAAVPATRYQAAHVHPAAQAPAATPDRNWQALNRIVAGQDQHGAGAHAGHAHPAPAPAREQQAAKDDPHAHHHGHHEHGQAGHARHQHQGNHE